MTVDARGLRCPLPVLRLARTMRLEAAVHSFELLSDDPATAGELNAWAAVAGHRVWPEGAGFRVERAP